MDSTLKTIFDKYKGQAVPTVERRMMGHKFIEPDEGVAPLSDLSAELEAAGYTLLVDHPNADSLVAESRDEENVVVATVGYQGMSHSMSILNLTLDKG